MSRRRPARALPLVERRQREFTCDQCGARPDQPCQTENRRPRSQSHTARWSAATAAGRLPLTDEEMER